MNDEVKKKVKDWWSAGADFDAGISLYHIYGHNKVLKYTMPGRKSRYYEKLKYELCKDVGLDWLKMPAIPKPLPSVTVAQPKHFDQAKLPDPKVENTEQYPFEVRRVINEYAECYRNRGKLHWEMCEVNDNNDPENCMKRSDLLLKIKLLSSRMDVLHMAREAYFSRKEIPNEASLWPKEQKELLAEQLPDNIDELKQMKKNIQVSMVKDRNWLDYQQKTKTDKKTPMPAGPKRMEIEKRIKAKLKKIEEIEYKLVELQ